MASQKRRVVPTQGGESTWDSSRFTFETAWHRYQDNVHLQWRQWHRVLTKLSEKQIDITLVKEFYSNIYVKEDRAPKYCKVQGQVIRFDAEAINDFLDTLVILTDREEYLAYL